VSQQNQPPVPAGENTFERIKRVSPEGNESWSARDLAAGVAKEAGGIQPLDYAIFMDHGYRGLYGGLTKRDIHQRKKLKPKQHILDHMGSTELAANLFRATQTEDKLRREKVRSKDQANQIHHQVGRKVRQTIRELGGTMPENLPVAESIKKVESREQKRLKAELKAMPKPEGE
jgi:DNA-damage-inducible protein D